MFALDRESCSGRRSCHPCVAPRACSLPSAWPGTCASATRRAPPRWRARRRPCSTMLPERRAPPRRGALHADRRRGAVAVRRSSMRRARWPTRRLREFETSATPPAAPTPTGCAHGSKSTAATRPPATPNWPPPPPTRAAPATRCAPTCSTPPPRCSPCSATCTQAEARWGSRFDPDAEGLHPAARGWIDDYLGTAAFQASDFGRAVALLMQRLRGRDGDRPGAARDQPRHQHRQRLHQPECAPRRARMDAARARPGAPDRLADVHRPGPDADAPRRCASWASATPRANCCTRRWRRWRRWPARAPTPIALEYQGDLALDGGDYARALDSFAPARSARRRAGPGRFPQRRAARPGARAVAPGPSAGSAGDGRRRAGAGARTRRRLQPDRRAEGAGRNPRAPRAAGAGADGRAQRRAALPAAGDGGGRHHRRLHRAGRPARRGGARVRRRRRLRARLRGGAARRRRARQDPQPGSDQPRHRDAGAVPDRARARPKASTTASWRRPKRSAPRCCSRPAPRSNTCPRSARRSPPTSTPRRCSARSTATCTGCSTPPISRCS